jgi:hypothetical protein
MLLSLLCAVQDEVASDCWHMLNEWEQLATELASENPSRVITAHSVGALVLAGRQKTSDSDSQAAAERLCDSLQDGWRPVLIHDVAPSVAHVPWLCHIDELTAAFGAPRPVADATSTGEPTVARGACPGHCATEVRALSALHSASGICIACREHFPRALI